MGIQESIIEDAKWQGIVESEEKFDRYKKKAILKLQEKGFVNEEIADILSLSIDEIDRLSKLEE